MRREMLLNEDKSVPLHNTHPELLYGEIWWDVELENILELIL